MTRIVIAHMKGIKGRAPASPAQVLLMVVSSRMLLLYKFMLGIMDVSRTLLGASALLEGLSRVLKADISAGGTNGPRG